MTVFSASRRVASLEVSEILAITARANAIRRAGLPVIVLGAGEPDFDTPEPVKLAAKAAIDRGETVAALDGPQDFIAERRESFRQRRDLVVDALNAIEGITCRRPEGAFYCYAECSGLMGKRTPDGRPLATDREFCAWLLDSAHVAVVPGAAFGASPCFRVSYPTSEAELTEAMARLAKAGATLR